MEHLNQYFIREQVAPEIMDKLWASGWRHFGTYFFRYTLAMHDGEIRLVLPLRVDLAEFSYSRSQKRILQKNKDLNIIIRETSIDQIKEEMFSRHRERFQTNIPDSIFDFLSTDPDSAPCQNHEICVYQGDRLLAASFLDIGKNSTSAVYAIFEPSESKRSLGILTILEAIKYSRSLGCRYYYPGYAYTGSSVYDYKKNIGALERYDWSGCWNPYSASTEPEFSKENLTFD
ncbi:MAG: arginine-tRNA-protein transferase [Acidobacteria bacterium]|nr:arginine-tRNA-protein transferase [Acidobacteriota bacterium]